MDGLKEPEFSLAGRSWRAGLALNLDRYSSRFQVKEVPGLVLQVNEQNSVVGFYPFWGMPCRHYQNLALLDLSSYPKRMKPSRHYLNC